MGLRGGFKLPEFPTADDAAKAAEKLGVSTTFTEFDVFGKEEDDYGAEEIVELFDTDPKPADPSNPTLAPTRPPVPEPGESMAGVFESNHGYFNAKPGTTPLDATVEKVIFHNAEAAIQGAAPEKDAYRAELGRKADEILARLKSPEWKARMKLEEERARARAREYADFLIKM